MESSELADVDVGPPKRIARWLSLTGVVLMFVASYGLPFPLGFVLGPLGFGLLIAGLLRWVYEQSTRSSIRQDVHEQRQSWSRAETLGFVVEMVVAILAVVVFGFVLVLGMAFGHSEPGEGPSTWFGVAFFAYPLTALAFAILAVRLWVRRSPWAHVTPLAIVLVPIAIAWLGLSLP